METNLAQIDLRSHEPPPPTVFLSWCKDYQLHSTEKNKQPHHNKPKPHWGATQRLMQKIVKASIMINQGEKTHKSSP